MSEGHLASLKILGGVALAAGVAVAACGEWEGITLEGQSSNLTTLYNTISNNGNESRAGWYDNQPGLDPSIVASASFGRRWDIALDLTPGEQVLAQPLVWNNRVLIVTEANNVYLLDANNNTGTNVILSKRNLAGETPVPSSSLSCGDITPTIGITGTPVIDLATNTAYFYAKNTGPGWRLHAIDLNSSTLADRAPFPVTISGTAQNDAAVTFNALRQHQRPGLLLMNGVVYAGFGAHCDVGQYNGWVIGVTKWQSATTPGGAIVTRFATLRAATSDHGNGIWMSGGGLMSDRSGDIVFATGNGPNRFSDASGPLAYQTAIPGNMPPTDFIEAVVRLRVQANNTLLPVDFFVPFNAGMLNQGDADLGSGPVVALPSQFGAGTSTPNLAVVGGKGGTLYLLNRDSFGGYRQNNNGDRVLSALDLGGSAHSRPAAWPGDGGYVYVTVNGGVTELQAYKQGVSNNAAILTRVGVAPAAEDFGPYSGSPIVTSNGTTSGTALVWAIRHGATMHAYRAVPVNGTLQSIFSFNVGSHPKFTSPGVGTGRLFVATETGRVMAFGTASVAPITGTPTDFGAVALNTPRTLNVTVTANVNLTISGSSSNNAVFTTGAPVTANLNANQSTTIPVTFRPTAVGAASATITVNTTTQGSGTFTVSGSGQSTTPVLSAPSQLNFNGVPLNQTKTMALTVTNTGGGTLTFATTNSPTAPFSAPTGGTNGIPTSGTTLAAGASRNIDVTFAPTSGTSFNQSWTINSNGGNRTVALVGATGTAGHLVITPTPPTAINYGSVATGSVTARSFTVANTGDLAITVNKSHPPDQGQFFATTSLLEGSTIPGHTTLNETVEFRPTAAGTFTDIWPITANDGQPQMDVTFTGTATGAAAALPRTGWVASASHTGAPDVPANAIDASLTSRWTTGVPMAAGMYFQVDMTSAKTVSQIRMDSSNGDHARAFSVFVTNDTANLGTAVATGTATGTPVNVSFAAKSGRFIRVVLGTIPAGTGAWWSIQDFNAFGTGGSSFTPIKINFQPAGAAVPAGYIVDAGDVFGARNGQTYGWNVSHTTLTRERNVQGDQRLDTLCHFHSGGIWEVAVPNGTYNVFVSIGDPSFPSTHTINVEGVNYWNALSRTANQFASMTRAVTVSDGRLSINQGSGAEMATRINYVEISQ